MATFEEGGRGGGGGITYLDAYPGSIDDLRPGQTYFVKTTNIFLTLDEDAGGNVFIRELDDVRFVTALPNPADAAVNTIYVLTEQATMWFVSNGEFKQLGGSVLSAEVDLYASAAFANPAANSLDGLHAVLGKRGTRSGTPFDLGAGQGPYDDAVARGDIPGSTVRFNVPAVTQANPNADPDDTLVFYRSDREAWYYRDNQDVVAAADLLDEFDDDGYHVGEHFFSPEIFWAHAGYTNAEIYAPGTGRFADAAELAAYVEANKGYFIGRYDQSTSGFSIGIAYFDTTTRNISIVGINSGGVLDVTGEADPDAPAAAEPTTFAFGAASRETSDADLVDLAGFAPSAWNIPNRVIENLNEATEAGAPGSPFPNAQTVIYYLSTTGKFGYIESSGHREIPGGAILNPDVLWAPGITLADAGDTPAERYAAGVAGFQDDAAVEVYVRANAAYFEAQIAAGNTEVLYINTTGGGTIRVLRIAAAQGGATFTFGAVSEPTDADLSAGVTGLSPDGVVWNVPRVVADDSEVPAPGHPGSPYFGQAVVPDVAYYNTGQQQFKFIGQSTANEPWTNNFVADGDAFWRPGITIADASATAAERYAVDAARFADAAAVEAYVRANAAYFSAQFADGKTELGYFQTSDQTIRLLRILSVQDDEGGDAATVTRWPAFDYRDVPAVADAPEDGNDWTLRGRQRFVGVAAVAGRSATVTGDRLAVNTDVRGGSLTGNTAIWRNPMVVTQASLPPNTAIQVWYLNLAGFSQMYLREANEGESHPGANDAGVTDAQLWSGIAWATAGNGIFPQESGRFANLAGVTAFILNNAAAFRAKYAAGRTKVGWFNTATSQVRVADYVPPGDVGLGAVERIPNNADIADGTAGVWRNPQVWLGVPAAPMGQVGYGTGLDQLQYTPGTQNLVIPNDATLWGPDSDITWGAAGSDHFLGRFASGAGAYANLAGLLRHLVGHEAEFVERARQQGKRRLAYFNTTRQELRIVSYTVTTPQVDDTPPSVVVDHDTEDITITYAPAAGGVVAAPDTFGPLKALVDVYDLNGIASEYFGTAVDATPVTRPVPWDAAFGGGESFIIEFTGVAGGPEQNVFTGVDKAAAVAALQAYSALNPQWRAAYQAEQRFTVALRWGAAGEGTTYILDETGVWRSIGLVWLKGQTGNPGVKGAAGTPGIPGADGSFNQADLDALNAARNAAQAARDDAQTARDDSRDARDESRFARDDAMTADDESRDARDESRFARDDSQAARDAAQMFANTTQDIAVGSPRGDIWAISPVLSPLTTHDARTQFEFGAAESWTVTAEGLAAGIAQPPVADEVLQLPFIAPAGTNGMFVEAEVNGIVVGDAYLPYALRTQTPDDFPSRIKVHAGIDTDPDPDVLQWVNINWRTDTPGQGDAFEGLTIFGGGTTIPANTRVRIRAAVVRGAAGPGGPPGGGGVPQATFDALLARVVALEAFHAGPHGETRHSAWRTGIAGPADFTAADFMAGESSDTQDIGTTSVTDDSTLAFAVPVSEGALSGIAELLQDGSVNSFAAMIRGTFLPAASAAQVTLDIGGEDHYVVASALAIVAALSGKSYRLTQTP